MRLFLNLIIMVGLGLSLAACMPATEAPPSPSNAAATDSAQAALVTYFGLLHQGATGEARELYGGSYDTLASFNPEIDPANETALFDTVCQALLCLEIRNVLEAEQISPSEFRFTVEFNQEDGSLFVLGPCCGASEEEMPPVSQFIYTVRLADDGRLLVMELPVYVP